MPNAIKVAAPPQRPVLLFDGDCNFCRRWISRWQDFTGDAVEYTPYQHASVAERFPELPSERMAQAVHLVTAGGAVHTGADAVFRALAAPTGRHWTVAAYQRLPAFARASEFFYGLVARHRVFFSSLTRLLWGAHVERPNHYYVRSLFLRGLGVVYLIAFLSLFTQIPGLIGARGILPASETMNSLREAADQQRAGFKRYALFPTLGWISATEGSVRLQAGAGIALALLLIIGIAPAPCLALLWALYLSLSLLSQIFLNYQWDVLLLETGFLAIFFAPPIWLRARGPHPSRTVLWLLRWLLFRLMFLSGCVKLLSGDPAWHNLTALQYHYETQPLPTWLAWHAHQLSPALHKYSTVAMFCVEIGLPFLIFLPRRLRFIAAAAFVLLQISIALTGNYTFFNLLTILLCVVLLDDAAISKFLPPRSLHVKQSATRIHPVFPTLRRITVGAVAIVVLSISGMLLWASFNRPSFDRPYAPPAALHSLYRAAAPFRSINNYGLFAVMTTNRMEIIVEGSNDGQEWRAYEFKHKPGALDRRPGFVAPHQPRLDWQMWFAALGNFRQNQWFMRFCQSLLQGSPPVLRLLDKNPFPHAPPKYIRARLYQYHFTTPAERARSGHWWRSQYKGPYCPVLSLKQ